MTRPLRIGMAVFATALASGVIAAGSQLPWTVESNDDAVVRLAWRAMADHIESCRPLTEEERERTPVHMRRDEICERTTVPYVLTVSVDGSEALVDTIAPAGARADRPLVVFHELRVSSGERVIDVAFAPVVIAGSAHREGYEAQDEENEGDEGEEHEEDEERRMPLDTLRFAEQLRLEPRQVGLITYDAERRAIFLVTPPAPVGPRPPGSRH